jgi:hypothetical protein
MAANFPKGLFQSEADKLFWYLHVNYSMHIRMYDHAVLCVYDHEKEQFRGIPIVSE